MALLCKHYTVISNHHYILFGNIAVLCKRAPCAVPYPDEAILNSSSSIQCISLHSCVGLKPMCKTFLHPGERTSKKSDNVYDLSHKVILLNTVVDLYKNNFKTCKTESIHGLQIYLKNYIDSIMSVLQCFIFKNYICIRYVCVCMYVMCSFLLVI